MLDTLRYWIMEAPMLTDVFIYVAMTMNEATCSIIMRWRPKYTAIKNVTNAMASLCSFYWSPSCPSSFRENQKTEYFCDDQMC